jgi:hypothetical protein
MGVKKGALLFRQGIPIMFKYTCKSIRIMQTQSPNTTLSVNFEAVEVYGILIFANLGVTSF